VSFAQEEITLKKYDEFAENTKNVARKAAIFQGSMGGIFLFLMFGFYIYSYGIASVLLEKK